MHSVADLVFGYSRLLATSSRNMILRSLDWFLFFESLEEINGISILLVVLFHITLLFVVGLKSI